MARRTGSRPQSPDRELAQLRPPRPWDLGVDDPWRLGLVRRLLLRRLEVVRTDVGPAGVAVGECLHVDVLAVMKINVAPLSVRIQVSGVSAEQSLDTLGATPMTPEKHPGADAAARVLVQDGSLHGTRIARPRTRPASRSLIADWKSSREYLTVCRRTAPLAASTISSHRSL